MKLELSLYASNLKNAAGAFKGVSDPFAIVTKLSMQQGEKPVVLGKTEVIKNNLSPEWVKVFVLDYELGTPQKIAVNLFDEVRKGNNIGMGSAVFDLGELLGSRGNTQAKRLKKGGNLFATVRKSEGSGIFRFKFKAEGLKNTEGLFSKSDPFFELSRKVSTTEGLSWDNVYRSDYIKKNLNPEWDEGSVEMSILCGGDVNLPIDLTIYDHEKSGKHVLMGRLETSVNALLEKARNGANQPMTLSKKGKTTGSLFVIKAEVVGASVDAASQPWAPPTAQMATVTINPPPSAPVVVGTSLATSDTAAGIACGAFVPMPPPGAPNSRVKSYGSSNKSLFIDYVSGGCEFSVVVAIDFTGSNGDPRKPDTLHHMDPYSRNQYEKAISAITSILLQYDSDKKIPVLGFGAKYGGVVRHCFQCGSTPEANGLQGVLDAYKSVFNSGLILSRPTVFNEVLETSAQRAESSQQEAQRRGGQAYTILLIVTDGAVSDVNATAACLNRICGAPLSVVIVGVGNADFSAMRFLDDAAIATGSRDIAQFVAFNEHVHSSQSLTRATLEEIPQQLVDYFQSKSISPLPPIMRSGDSIAHLAFTGEAEEEIDLNLDIGEDEIVVTGGGIGYYDGFNARY